MKRTLFIIPIFFLTTLLMNCSGSSDKSNNRGENKTLASSAMNSTGSNNCENNIFFAAGAVINTSSYDGQGKEVSKQTSTVKKVYSENGVTLSEIEMVNTTVNESVGKTMKAVYKCDGKELYVDLSGFLSDSKQPGKIETSGLMIPFEPAVGEMLPDANYSIHTEMGGRIMDLKSHITERKVEAKELVSTRAGDFNCFRISSVIETESNIPGMDEKSKKIMEEVKKKMGKNMMTFWFSPGTAIIKMELKMGDKLLMRSEITGIEKAGK